VVDPARCPTSSLLSFRVDCVDLVPPLLYAAQQACDQLLPPRKAVWLPGRPCFRAQVKGSSAYLTTTPSEAAALNEARLAREDSYAARLTRVDSSASLMRSEAEMNQRKRPSGHARLSLVKARADSLKRAASIEAIFSSILRKQKDSFERNLRFHWDCSRCSPPCRS
jgi:hypothetical protein